MASKPYAVFLCYSSDDRDFVERIAIHLTDKAKLRPWFDQWSMLPGESWERGLERGLDASSTCAVFVGATGQGPWLKHEVEVALRQQMQTSDFRVILILLPNAPKPHELPAFLSGSSSIAFRHETDDEALWRLECEIRGVPSGQGSAHPIAEPASAEKSASRQESLTRLVQLLGAHFDREEMRTLCFNLGIDYDDLPAEGRINKARELVTYLERRVRIPELVQAIRQSRPDTFGSVDLTAIEKPLATQPERAQLVDMGQTDIAIATVARPAQVFISYRHQEPDNTLAHAFAGVLKQAGHGVFIDTGIRWGTDWVREIRQALERADYLLLLLSPEAATSEMVVEEVAIAKELAHQQNGRPVILPVRVCFPFSEPLPYHLSAYLRVIQQECWDGPNDTPRLVRQLLATIADQTHWPPVSHGETPPGGARSSAPQPHFDPRDLVIPGGALDVDSRFYIVRETDEEVFSAVHRSRAMVTVRGPRQTGKTSLVMRVYAAVHDLESQLKVVFVDFQALSNDEFSSLDTLWYSIAIHIAEQLSVEGWDPAEWKSNVSHDRNLSRFLDHFVFKGNERPLLVCLDEVDSVFKFPIKSEFFASIRAFYNRGAFDSAWKKVRWLFATSSEPSFFIEDLTQSPFNVGLRIELNAFTHKEVDELAHRHGLALEHRTLYKIMDYVGGRPYLAHLLLYQLARNPAASDQLFDAQTAGGGIFRDHLHRYLMQFQREEALAEAMKSVISNKCCKDVRMADRLEAAGLVRRDESQRIVPFCRLYADFFEKALT